MIVPSLKPGWTMVKFGEVVKSTNLVERNPMGQGIERTVGIEHIDPENLHIRRGNSIPVQGDVDPLAASASGLLLHPSVGNMVNEAVMIQNHEIRFATFDLGATAKEIRRQLLQVL